MRILDPAIIRQFADDLPQADLLAIIGTFTQDQARLTDELAAAFGSKNYPEFHRAAHSLAGAAAAVGALALEHAARIAMAAGERPDETMIKAIRTCGALTSQAIAEFLAGVN